ncbi:MAG: hypothetical protein LBC76_03465, partial [Treponema sp.]|nr:hypothetical protein [Treponema sp.]
ILFFPELCPRISTLYKCTDFKLAVDFKESSPSKFKGSHLIVGYYKEKTLHSYIVPLEYLLGTKTNFILRDGTYQVYSHTILSTNNQAVITKDLEVIRDNRQYGKIPSVQQFHKNNAFIYVGITKRTWLERYREHFNAMCRGSKLRFHRALRGELCKIGILEHIVERAGLTEKQAMEIEEKEVEKRALHSLHPNGLNMIPGGYAGLHCVSNFASRTGYKLKQELNADTLESVLVDVQQNLLKKHFNTTNMKRVNYEISRLWMEDINYRINVTTHHNNRFSFPQIQAARIWEASGWSKEKIFESLHKIDAKELNMDQLDRLLKGETYASIPDVLI